MGHDISCGNGTSTPAETRCLYNLDEFKNIIGCRNLNHLQNCGIIAKFMINYLRVKNRLIKYFEIFKRLVRCCNILI